MQFSADTINAVPRTRERPQCEQREAAYRLRTAQLPSSRYVKVAARRTIKLPRDPALPRRADQSPRGYGLAGRQEERILQALVHVSPMTASHPVRA